MPHSAILTTNLIDSKVILGDYYSIKKNNPIVFQGISHKIEKDSILAVKVYSLYSTK